MRTLCDVCEAAAAEVFCAADEAALCAACDEKVHGCNKLASRHVRLKLAESRAVPKCDICESAPAFFYCGVDGTSLCLQCDLDVHIGGKKAHERFLLMAQRVELPKTSAQEGQAPVNGLNERGRAAMNGAAEHGDGDSPRKGADRHPPSSTAATAPGRDSLAGAKDRTVRPQSAAKAGSDAPAVAIAVGDEVEGGMAVETPGADGAPCDALRDSPGPGGPQGENGLEGIKPKMGTREDTDKDVPSIDLNSRPKRSPQIRNGDASGQGSDELPYGGSVESGEPPEELQGPTGKKLKT